MRDVVISVPFCRNCGHDDRQHIEAIQQCLFAPTVFEQLTAEQLKRLYLVNAGGPNEEMLMQTMYFREIKANTDYDVDKDSQFIFRLNSYGEEIAFWVSRQDIFDCL